MGQKDKKIILVTCDKKEEFRRIKNRNDWSDKENEERLGGQLPGKIKELKSWVVINTNCSMKKLKEKIEILYKKVKGEIDEKIIL